MIDCIERLDRIAYMVDTVRPRRLGLIREHLIDSGRPRGLTCIKLLIELKGDSRPRYVPNRPRLDKIVFD